MRCCELFDVEPFPVFLTEVSNANEVKGSRTAAAELARRPEDQRDEDPLRAAKPVPVSGSTKRSSLINVFAGHHTSRVLKKA